MARVGCIPQVGVELEPCLVGRGLYVPEPGLGSPEILGQVDRALGVGLPGLTPGDPEQGRIK